MDKIVPIMKYASKRELATKAIRDMILSGQLVPGQRLRQEELTRALGISATPVREAIRLLEADGLLVGQPHCGVSVVEITADELQDISRIRSTLEALATRQAVDRADPDVYDSTLQRLESLQRQMEHFVKTGRPDQIANPNRDFHLLLYDLSNSPHLIDIIRRLWMHLPGYLVWENPKLSAASVEQHKAILEALRARHAEAAAQAMQVHIELSAHALMPHLRGRDAKSPRTARAGGAPADRSQFQARTE